MYFCIYYREFAEDMRRSAVFLFCLACVMLGIKFCGDGFIVLLPVGLFFTFKATTDAALFDGDSWKKFFQKLFKRKRDNNVETST